MFQVGADALDDDALAAALRERDVQRVSQLVLVALHHQDAAWRAAAESPIVEAYLDVAEQSANATRCLVRPTTDRSARSKATYKPSHRAKQRRAEANEGVVARAVAGRATGDQRPMDVTVTIEDRLHGVEVKTFVDNTRDMITMHKTSLARKRAWGRRHRAIVHTVVVDDRHETMPERYSGYRMWYRRGVGNYSLRTMIPVTEQWSLRELLSASPAKLRRIQQTWRASR